MPKPRPPHLHREQTRHGAHVWYVRKGHGPRIRLKAEYGSAEFWAHYAALEGVPPKAKQPKTSSLHDITNDAIRQGRERRAQTPHSANVFIKTMRGFYAWALEEKLVAIDPTKGIKLLRGPNDENGFHTWTQAELARFEVHWRHARALGV